MYQHCMNFQGDMNIEMPIYVYTYNQYMTTVHEYLAITIQLTKHYSARQQNDNKIKTKHNDIEFLLLVSWCEFRVPCYCGIQLQCLKLFVSWNLFCLNHWHTCPTDQQDISIASNFFRALLVILYVCLCSICVHVSLCTRGK